MGRKYLKGQVILEFTACMVIVFLMIFAIIRILKWSGLDLANRRIAHDDKIFLGVNPNYHTASQGPLKQIDPYIMDPTPIDAVWKGN